MAECDLTFSTFSAGANSPTGVRKGWHAKVSDQLIGGKRFIGRTASAAATEPSLNTTKGHHSIIIDDCINDCKIYGSTYSRTSDGMLNGVAQVRELVSCGPGCIYPAELLVTFGGIEPCGDDICNVNWLNSGLPISLALDEGGDPSLCAWNFFGEVCPGLGLWVRFVIDVAASRVCLIALGLGGIPGFAPLYFVSHKPLFGCPAVNDMEFFSNQLVCGVGGQAPCAGGVLVAESGFAQVEFL